MVPPSTAPEPRREVLRRWAARTAFLASLLALLGTGKPKGWVVNAAPAAPTVAAAGRALELDIDSSAPPVLTTSGGKLKRSGWEHESPCLVPWTAGKPVACLLPAGETLDDVKIEGSCGGCANGCPPPAGSFVKVVTKEIDAWTDTGSARLTVGVPKHPAKFIATRLFVGVSGAPLASMKINVTPKGGGAAIYTDEHACTLSSAGKAGCNFLLYDDVVGPAKDVDIVAEATAEGPCATGACSAPKTFHVGSIEVLE